MKLNPYNLGACGAVQMFHAGTVKFDTAGIKDGVVISNVPKGMIVSKAVAKVSTAFNAGTTNTLTVGLKDEKNEVFNDTDITSGTVGVYQKQLFLEMGEHTEIYVKYDQTGTEATAGCADIYLEVVPGPAE